METVKLTAGGESIVFSGAPFVLSSFSWGNVPGEHRSVKLSPTGSLKLQSAFGARHLKLEGYIIAEGDGLEEKERFLFEARRLLARVVNPMGEFTLSRGKYSIVCTPDSSCTYSNEPFFRRGEAERFTVEATAYNPCFTEEVRLASRSLYRGMATFPLTLTSGGSPLGLRESAGVLTVVNPGDVAAGCVIELECESALTDLRIEVASTGEYIALSGEFQAGERIVIDTRSGSRGVTAVLSGAEGGHHLCPRLAEYLLFSSAR